MARAAQARPAADLPDRIVDTALQMADEVGWERVRIRDIADRLEISLADVLAHYRDREAIADAWLRRGVVAMLEEPPEGFAELPPAERIEIVMMRFFDALAGHRRTTAQMIRGKLWPSHPHHWVPLIFNLSRTVQWLREAALLEARGPRRGFEEIALTGLFLGALSRWARDDSPGQERTRLYIRRRLERGDRFMSRRRRPDPYPHWEPPPVRPEGPEGTTPF